MLVVLGEEAEGHGCHRVVAPGPVQAAEQVAALLGKEEDGGLGKEATKTRGDTSPPPSLPGADTAPVFGVPPWPPPLLAAAPGAALLREQLRDQRGPAGCLPPSPVSWGGGSCRGARGARGGHVGLVIGLHGGVGGPFACWGRKGKPGGVLEVPRLQGMCDPCSASRHSPPASVCPPVKRSQAPVPASSGPSAGFSAGRAQRR